MRRSMVLIATVLIACGGDDHATPDGPGDTTPPMLVSTSPADGSAHNSILTSVSATFDKSLDPASIDTTTFALAGLFGGELPDGTVSYDDASKTITFTPLLPLAHDVRYTLTIGAVRDVAGNAFAGAAVKWRTTVNALVRTIQHNISNQIVAYSMSTVDGDGHVAQTVGCSDPGMDGVYMTTDDVYSNRFDFTYNADGQITKRTAYNIGADGKPNTGDDTINSYTTIAYDNQGAIAEAYSYSDAGMDGIWGTTDDVIFRHVVSKQGFHPTQVFTFTNAGIDGMWNTADDRGTSYGVNVYDAQFRATRLETHLNGTDGIPLTSDDTVGQYVANVYGTDHSFRQATYTSAGTDTMWFTGDDGVGSWIQNTADASGAITVATYYSGAGTDTMWFTGDDMIDSRDVYTNVTKLPTLDLFYSAAGTDTVWGTTDDVIGDYATWAYTSSGDTTVFKIFNDAGPDTKWQTGDDIVEVEQDFDIAH